MNFDLSVITANAIVIVPIVIAIVQAIKLTGFIPDHYSPLLAILVGIIIGWLSDHDNADLTLTVLSGAVYGLMASGLYSGIVTTVKAHARMKEQREKNPNQQKNSNNPNKC
jgi:Bacteriophage A118-like holin, Hol118